MFEALVTTDTLVGQVSQSAQWAPFNPNYEVSAVWRPEGELSEGHGRRKRRMERDQKRRRRESGRERGQTRSGERSPEGKGKRGRRRQVETGLWEGRGRVDERPEE